ncbi:MAG: T9SS type A sorting domain-containing protein [Bacteroidetes bacterium]|nr:MAG: T9SS type A sorting domain-containing protein [Bacteroidota bacterium]
MKKFLLSFLLISSVSLVFAQDLPCVTDYKINNGGGQCPDLNGLSATGTITLSFDGTIDANNIPLIVSVAAASDPGTPLTDIIFGAGELHNNGTVTYCYYVGPNNINNLSGHNAQFIFRIAYQTPNGLVPCGSQSPLPVSFRLFTASRSNNAVAIKWTTASETNNLGFEIQRLIGSGSWQTVSFVTTQAVNGYSASEIAYSFSDQNPTKGVTQYRIKQVDIDQRARFSEIRAVRGLGQMAKTIVYPNPSISGNKVSIVFDEITGTRDASLIDLNGRVIKQWKNITNNNLQIENLVPGLYNLRVILRETGEQTIEKIVVNKN